MQLFEDFQFYSTCKQALIESYGDVELTKKILKSSGFDKMNDYVLEQNIILIKESLGDKILNFFSRAVGGDIDKIDSILGKIKEEETSFIKDENEAESKFYKLTAALAQLRKEGARPAEADIIRVKLTKVQKLIKDLISSHGSIMDDLEKQIDILTKKSKRKAEYYNLKRAENSVETKKMRAELKKKLVAQEEDDEYLRNIRSILGTTEDAERDLEKARRDYEKAKESLEAQEKLTEETRLKMQEVINLFKESLDKKVKDIKEYALNSADKIQELDRKKKLNRSNFKKMEEKFYKDVEELEGEAEKAIGKISTITVTDPKKVSEKDKSIKYLLDIKSNIDVLQYYEWPISPDRIRDGKELIENVLKNISSASLPK
jgi:hypothetical protein